MAESGKFNAKIELNLVNCGSEPGFPGKVEFEGLKGTCNSLVIVRAGTSDSCVDVANAKSCSLLPRFLSLRPARVLFETRDKDKWIPPKPTDWQELDGSGITQDALATVLSFKTPSDSIVSLGRPQFYFDGLINLLLPAKGCSSDSTSVKLTFSLLDHKTAGLLLDKDKKPTADCAKAEKRLVAVTVLLVVAYGDTPPTLTKACVDADAASSGAPDAAPTSARSN